MINNITISEIISWILTPGLRIALVLLIAYLANRFALGLASQAIIKDYISGIMILLEDQFRVGEKIEAGGKTGLVEDFNLRRTVLRGENNELFYVPNSQIIVTANFKR